MVYLGNLVADVARSPEALRAGTRHAVYATLRQVSASQREKRRGPGSAWLPLDRGRRDRFGIHPPDLRAFRRPARLSPEGHPHAAGKGAESATTPGKCDHERGLLPQPVRPGRGWG